MSSSKQESSYSGKPMTKKSNQAECSSTASNTSNISLFDRIKRKAHKVLNKHDVDKEDPITNYKIDFPNTLYSSSTLPKNFSSSYKGKDEGTVRMEEIPKKVGKPTKKGTSVRHEQKSRPMKSEKVPPIIHVQYSPTKNNGIG